MAYDEYVMVSRKPACSRKYANALSRFSIWKLHLLFWSPATAASIEFAFNIEQFELSARAGSLRRARSPEIAMGTVYPAMKSFRSDGCALRCFFRDLIPPSGNRIAPQFVRQYTRRYKLPRNGRAKLSGCSTGFFKSSSRGKEIAPRLLLPGRCCSASIEGCGTGWISGRFSL